MIWADLAVGAIDLTLLFPSAYPFSSVNGLDGRRDTPTHALLPRANLPDFIETTDVPIRNTDTGATEVQYAILEWTEITTLIPAEAQLVGDLIEHFVGQFLGEVRLTDPVLEATYESHNPGANIAVIPNLVQPPDRQLTWGLALRGLVLAMSDRRPVPRGATFVLYVRRRYRNDDGRPGHALAGRIIFWISGTWNAYYNNPQFSR